MWGNNFPVVFSTRDDYSDSSLFIQWITSLPVDISPAFISRPCKNFTLWREGLTLPNLAISRQVLHETHDESIETRIATNKPKQRTNVLIRHPHLSLNPFSQRGPLEPFTVHTLRLNFYYTHHNIHNSLPRETKPNRFDIDRLLHKLFCSPPYLKCQPFDNDGPTTTANSATTRGAHSSASRKRKASRAPARKPRGRRLNKNNGGGDDGDNNNSPPDPRNNHHTHVPAEPEQDRFFACHFFKLNPREHDRCGSKQLVSVDTLKQHIKRNHYSPALHCNRCWEEFGDDQVRLRNHTGGSGHCDRDESQGPDTLYDEDLPLLDTRRGASDEEKWYQIWDQLCPDHPRPDSPYIERNGIDEFGGLIGREIQLRILALLPNLRRRFGNVVHPDITTRIITEAVNDAFSQPTLFDLRFRRIFRPAITAPPETGTHQMEAPPQSPSDLLPPNPYDPGLQDNYQLIAPNPLEFPNYDYDPVDPNIFDNIDWNNI